MALVKSLKNRVYDVNGSPKVGRTATLKNNGTGATIGTVLTDANGEWVFLNNDETVKYRVEIAEGGASSQKVMVVPVSAEADDFYVNTSMRVGIPGTGATVRLDLATSQNLKVVKTEAGGVELHAYQATTGQPRINFYKARGTEAAPTIVADGDPLMAHLVYGYDGAAWEWAGAIEYFVDGAPSAGIVPTRLEFFTENAAGTLTLATRINSSQQLLVQDGTAAAPGFAFINDINTGVQRSAADTINFIVGGINPLTVKASGGVNQIGFFGTAPISKPAVTGSRGGNAALASCLTQLAALGLITDSSTA